MRAASGTTMTRRRWIAEHWDEATATILGLQAEHMARVLRAHPGTEADVVAGGHVFHAEVASVSTNEVRFNLLAEVQADPALPVTLVLSVYKFDRIEWALEKATELGVAAVAPVIARRTEKYLALGADKRIERWRRIVHDPRCRDAGFTGSRQLRIHAHCVGRAGAHHHAAPRDRRSRERRRGRDAHAGNRHWPRRRMGSR